MGRFGQHVSSTKKSSVRFLRTTPSRHSFLSSRFHRLRRRAHTMTFMQSGAYGYGYEGIGFYSP